MRMERLYGRGTGALRLRRSSVVRRAAASLLAFLLALPAGDVRSATFSGTIQGVVRLGGRPLSGVTVAFIDLQSGSVVRATSGDDGDLHGHGSRGRVRGDDREPGRPHRRPGAGARGGGRRPGVQRGRGAPWRWPPPCRRSLRLKASLPRPRLPRARRPRRTRRRRPGRSSPRPRAPGPRSCSSRSPVSWPASSRCSTPASSPSPPWRGRGSISRARRGRRSTTWRWARRRAATTASCPVRASKRARSRTTCSRRPPSSKRARRPARSRRWCVQDRAECGDRKVAAFGPPGPVTGVLGLQRRVGPRPRRVRGRDGHRVWRRRAARDRRGRRGHRGRHRGGAGHRRAEVAAAAGRHPALADPGADAVADGDAPAAGHGVPVVAAGLPAGLGVRR